MNYWFRANRPEVVFLVAGTVGGIMANSTRPAEFLYDNMMIHATVVEAARHIGTTKLLYLGSSCIYPRECPQPIREEHLLTGPLEPTNEAYALAKIAGIRLCQSYRTQYGCDFISAMPTNLYGPGDNFAPASSHVIPALIRKCVEARDRGGNLKWTGSRADLVFGICHLLGVRPLREKTTYAVVLTDRLVGADGNAVRSPWPWVNHLRQTEALRPLGDALPALNLGIDNVAFAWTFTTGDVTGDLRAARQGLLGKGTLAGLEMA